MKPKNADAEQYFMCLKLWILWRRRRQRRRRLIIRRSFKQHFGIASKFMLCLSTNFVIFHKDANKEWAYLRGALKTNRVCQCVNDGDTTIYIQGAFKLRSGLSHLSNVHTPTNLNELMKLEISRGKLEEKSECCFLSQLRTCKIYPLSVFRSCSNRKIYRHCRTHNYT